MSPPDRTELRQRFATLAPQLLRIVVAAVVGWVICQVFHPPSPPVFAAVVPLVAMRDQPYSAFNVAFDRLGGVMCGVLLGVAVVGLLGPSTVSVALVLTVGLVVGMLLKLGSGINIQVAASALLVFVNPDPGVYAWSRLLETLVGALVTTALSPFLFPPDAAGDYRRALARAGEQLGDHVSRVADVVETGRPDHDALVRIREAAGQTEERTRRLPAELTAAQRAVGFNPLRHRDRPLLQAMLGPTRLATDLGREVRQMTEEVADLSMRGDLKDLWTQQGPPLAGVLRPLGDVIRQDSNGLRGRPDSILGVEQARAALDAWSATDRSAVAGAVRRPAARVLSRLEHVKGR